MRHPVTPDGRYFVVRGRLWRCADPSLPEEERRRLVAELMAARRAVARARRAGDADAVATARAAVDEAKRGLGERGPVWWDDGAPDYNRSMAESRMAFTRPKDSYRRLWLAIGIVLFVGAASLLAAGQRELHNWLLLVGTFANVMVFLAPWRHRARAG